MSELITKPFDLKDVRVMIGMPAGRDLPWQTVESLMGTICLLKDRGVRFDVCIVAGSSLIESARCNVAYNFMKSKSTHLFMLDSDMGWKPQDFLRVLCLCTEMPVVCGAYIAKNDRLEFMLAEQDWSHLESNEYGCLRIRGMGLGFTCVQRSVMEKLAESAPKLKFNFAPEPVSHFFRCDEINGVFRGEDISFFDDMRKCDIPVHMDPTVQLEHIGPKVYTASFMSVLKEKTVDEPQELRA